MVLLQKDSSDGGVLLIGVGHDYNKESIVPAILKRFFILEEVFILIAHEYLNHLVND